MYGLKGKGMINNINNGIPWFDQRNETINAHGGCLIKENGLYYFFGEYKTNDINKFVGFSCYSSEDLVKWKLENIVLKTQKEGILGNDRIGERVKVVKSKKNNTYVMLMHTDNLTYTDPQIGVAVCDAISGMYHFVGNLTYQNEPIRAWDMGTFTDDDGTNYLLLHEGSIYQLSDDCLKVEKVITKNISPGGESPAMFRDDDYFYFLFSNKTSWERNDNYYFSSKSLLGPWEKKGYFCPEGKLTYNSQCTFVFQEIINNKRKTMYMGDRWSFPRQASSATYVWLPIETDEGAFKIDDYLESWRFFDDVSKSSDLQETVVSFNARNKDVILSKKMYGYQFSVFGKTSKESGYCEISVFNTKNKLIHKSIIDFYSLIPSEGIRYISPKLPLDNYKIEIMPLEETGIWYKKNGEKFGGLDTEICVTKICESK